MPFFIDFLQFCSFFCVAFYNFLINYTSYLGDDSNNTPFLL